TFRLMRPSVNTTGVNVSVTPNFLNSIEGGQVEQVPGIGNGNSPPTRKFAVSPEIAVRFGSASVRTTPARSIARSVAVTFVNVPVSELVGGTPLIGNPLLVLKFTTAVP